MSRFDQATIATTILTLAPGWARVGITAANARLREDAAHELARTILERIDGAGGEGHDPDQLALGF